MAKYTLELRTLMDDPAARARLDAAMSTYPLYTPAEETAAYIPNREELNERLLKNYKYREIAFETPGRFLEELENTMKIIMPRYNELFRTVVIMAGLPSPFDNVDVTETFEQTRSDQATTKAKGSTSTTSTTGEETAQTVNGKVIEADTPQGSIVTAPEIEGVSSGSMAKWSKDNTTVDHSTTAEATGSTENEDTVTASATTKHTYTKKGNQGVNTYAHDMNEFRTSIIDVVDQIINDTRVRELFMTVY